MKNKILLLAAILGLFLLAGAGRADEKCEAFIAGLLPATANKDSWTCDYVPMTSEYTLGTMSHLEVRTDWERPADDLRKYDVVFRFNLFINKYLPSFPNWEMLKNELYRKAREEFDKDVKEWSEAKDDTHVKYAPGETKSIMDGKSFCQKITELAEKAEPGQMSGGASGMISKTMYRCRYLVTADGVTLQLTVSEENKGACDGYFTKAREKAKKM
jgi:hypothetical protein